MTRRIDTPEAFGKVAVLLGGRSAEREISLQSGAAVLGALQQQAVDAHALDPADDDVVRQLLEGGFDRVFNALHGRGGEDGVVQGLLDYLGIPYTGSGVLGSALAMDKLRTKQLWHGVGIPTPAFSLLHSEADVAKAAGLGFPLILKPVHEGSSLGMTKVTGEADLLSAWQAASQYDHDVLAESWIEGPEFTVAIVSTTVLPLILLETPREFYDYEAKYQVDTTRYHCPCGLPEEQESLLQTLSLQAFNAVAASGWGRVDFMLDAEDKPWFIEVNTIPGMTDHSLVPMAARAHGWALPELVWRLLETSMEKQA